MLTQKVATLAALIQATYTRRIATPLPHREVIPPQIHPLKQFVASKARSKLLFTVDIILLCILNLFFSINNASINQSMDSDSAHTKKGDGVFPSHLQGEILAP
jgi:hypothetical protein